MKKSLFLSLFMVIIFVPLLATATGGLCGPTEVDIDLDGDGNADCIGYQWDCPQYGMEALSISDCPGYNGTHPKTGITAEGDPIYDLDQTRVFIVYPNGTIIVEYIEE